MFLFGSILFFVGFVGSVKGNDLGYFSIVHEGSKRCLDVANNINMDIIIYDCRPDSDSQLWTNFEGDKLMNKMYPQMCINHASYEGLWLGPCDYKSAFVSPIEDRVNSELRLKISGLCLQNFEGNSDNLTRIVAKGCAWWFFSTIAETFKIKPKPLT